MRLIVYGKEGCAPCKALKEGLNEKGIDFEYKDVMSHLEEVGEYGIRSVPTTIVIDAEGKEVKRVVGNKLEEILIK